MLDLIKEQTKCNITQYSLDLHLLHCPLYSFLLSSPYPPSFVSLLGPIIFSISFLFQYPLPIPSSKYPLSPPPISFPSLYTLFLTPFKYPFLLCILSFVLYTCSCVLLSIPSSILYPLPLVSSY